MKNRSSQVLRWLICLLTAQLGGCLAANHADQLPSLAAAGWQVQDHAGGDFTLLAYHEPSSSAPVVDIYLHGDGRAFLRPGTIARDPTPRHSVAATLALSDPNIAVFLARPCYYGRRENGPCEADMWTYRRYGPRVVDAVAAATGEIADAYPGAEIRLIGYSGGGVIALLAARQLSQVSTVVTIAAPLDTEQWALVHGYSALAPQSNPAALSNWPSRLRQVHLVGSRDRSVPPAIAQAYIERSGATVELHEFAEFDHDCCWARAWPDILAAIATHATADAVPSGPTEEPPDHGR